MKKATRQAGNEKRKRVERSESSKIGAVGKGGASRGDVRVTRAQKERALRLLEALREHYPDAHCELEYRTPHELLVATILSAQATDVSVNKVTPELFRRFPSPAHFAAAKAEDIEPLIKSIGLFRGKAKSIHAAMTTLVEKFGGQVPKTMDELLTLRGVARKTANVVLGNAFGINVGFVVDTHIERLSKRLGLAPANANVAQVEQWLMALLPQETWCDASHMIIWHGRRACKARPAGGKLGGCCEHPICREFGATCGLRSTHGKESTIQSRVC